MALKKRPTEKGRIGCRWIWAWALLICLVPECLFGSGVYKYKDEKGVWHFSDSPVDLPEESQTMAGMIERDTQIVDLRTKLMSDLAPRNDIERAVIATVAIQSTIGFGSGFFITENGYILTNKHVLQFTDDQEKQTQQGFSEAESNDREIMEKLRAEEEQLKNARRDLQANKAFIDSQTDSAAKELNRNRYLSDLQALVGWEESFLKRKKAIAQHQKELSDKRTQFNREASVAALSQSFTVFLADDTRVTAYLVKRSETQDLALLKVDGFTTPYLVPSLFPPPARGDAVYAIGNPAKLRNSVSSGTFSGFEGAFAKTDAKIYPGNSGGPLITQDGKVIGVNTFKQLTHQFEGLGFAVTIDCALREFSGILPDVIP